MNTFQQEIQDYHDHCATEGYVNKGDYITADIIDANEETQTVVLGVMHEEVGYVTYKDGVWELTDLPDGLESVRVASLKELCEDIGRAGHDAYNSLPIELLKDGATVKFALTWAAAGEEEAQRRPVEP